MTVSNSIIAEIANYTIERIYMRRLFFPAWSYKNKTTKQQQNTEIGPPVSEELSSSHQDPQHSDKKVMHMHD